MDEETQRTLGKQCKRRTMHHVTINQKEQKEKTKRSKLQTRKLSPEELDKQRRQNRVL
jgi:hypothetical protein